MGGERASKTRQREAGRICARCSVPLGPPPAGHRPGLTTGARGLGNQERFCPRCQPRLRIVCHALRQECFSVTFADIDGRTPIGPWLLLDTEAELDRILRWGGITPQGTPAEWADHKDSLRRWNVCCVGLQLTPRQRAALIARRQGWPWNGYELLQMKAAGRYPPQRLTPAQEQAFLRNRKR